MTQYYELSTDYELAERFLKAGCSLAAWLTIDGRKDLYILSFRNGLIKLHGHSSLKDSFDYQNYNAQFLLMVPDPTIELKADFAELKQQCSKLQSSLTQALNEADEVRNELTVANTCISELEALNTTANEALTAIAKQLGFESFSDEDVMGAIADLYDQIEGRDAALRGSAASHKDREIATLKENLTRSQSDKIDGAIYLIKRVLYDAISRLDP